MFIKVISIILGVVLLFNVSAYAEVIIYQGFSHLNKTSSFQDPDFIRECMLLVSLLESIKKDNLNGIKNLSANTNITIVEDAFGLWLYGAGWKIRVFEKSKHTETIVQSSYRMIYEDAINDEVKIQVYFVELGEEEKTVLKEYLIKDNLSSLTRLVFKAILGSKNISFGLIDEKEDIHEAIFEKAAQEGRLFTEDTVDDIKNSTLRRNLKHAFLFVRTLIKDNEQLSALKYVIIKEEEDNPTLYYTEDPFSSVLAHSGKRTNTIYIGLRTVLSARGNAVHKKGLFNLILHESRDIQRGYHLDLDDEVSAGMISYEDVNSIDILWADLITNGEFSALRKEYLERAIERRDTGLFMQNIPANIRLVGGSELYSFQHGVAEGLPDLVSLNIKLFSGMYSRETQIFILRHCLDRIRYDMHKTTVNDVEYLLTLTKKTRMAIIQDLADLQYSYFLRDIIAGYATGQSLRDDTKKTIREYAKLQFKVYTSPDGAEIHYSVGGNPKAKKTLVFIHGILVTPRDWRMQITCFEEEYRIIAVNLRGFGKSTLGTLPPNILNYAADINGILEQEDIQDAALVGHSMGGMVALNMAVMEADKPVQARRIKQMVLICSDSSDPMKHLPWHKRYLMKFLIENFGASESLWNTDVFRWSVKRHPTEYLIKLITELGIFEENIDSLIIRKIISSVLKNKRQSVEYAFRAIETHDVTSRLAEIEIPVLWIMGKGDWVTPMRNQERTAQLVRNRTVFTIEGKHYPHVYRPRKVNLQLYRFFHNDIYQFRIRLCKEVADRYGVKITLDELDEDIERIKMRILPQLVGIAGEQVELIDEISRLVNTCSADVTVSDEIMVKAVMIISAKVIPAFFGQDMKVRPVLRDAIEEAFGSIRSSA
jgi:pimeloyl-ACP methyl ester carboxylesterase